MYLDDAVSEADVLGAFGSGKPVWKPALLSPVGTVQVSDQLVRYTRPGLTEEYSVSVDGVRQDFVVEQRPEGEGELRVELDVTGAKAEPLANGARLVLDGSGRKLAYARLRAVDARGRELAARLEVRDSALILACEVANQELDVAGIEREFDGIGDEMAEPWK